MRLYFVMQLPRLLLASVGLCGLSRKSLLSGTRMVCVCVCMCVCVLCASVWCQIKNITSGVKKLAY